MILNILIALSLLHMLFTGSIKRYIDLLLHLSLIHILGYRAMAKKYHPDITKDNGEKMKSINEIKDKLDNIF